MNGVLQLPEKMLHAPKSVLVLLICIVTVTGCANLETTTKTFIANLMAHPMPRPIFVGELHPEPGSQNNHIDRVCIGLNGAYLWESGDKVEDKDQPYWQSHMSLTIDGKSIPFTKTTIVMAGGLLVFNYDNDKHQKLLGTYDAFYMVCLDVHLAKGLHLASVRVLTTSGIVNQYTWAFSLI